jgi:hypothetical protein
VDQSTLWRVSLVYYQQVRGILDTMAMANGTKRLATTGVDAWKRGIQYDASTASGFPAQLFTMHQTVAVTQSSKSIDDCPLCLRRSPASQGSTPPESGPPSAHIRAQTPRNSALSRSQESKKSNSKSSRRPSSAPQPLAINTMSLRLLPRALPRTLRSYSSAKRAVVSGIHAGQGRRYATSQARENPTSSAEQVSTSQPVSAKEIPLTIDSHAEITRNPNHTQKV